MTPTVRVVAVTRFLGVPDELLDWEKANAAHERGQNTGSDCARLIECAGRTCYDSYGKGRSSAEYHAHILEVGHGSVLEHASISFHISGVSRGLTHELVRHRVGVAISQRSTRYVDESESEWAWHPLVADEDYDLAAYDAHGLAVDLYKDLFRRISDRLIARGVSQSAARKQARGAARGALGNALSTELVWTANIRALRHFIEMRATEHADGEIRLLANALYLAAQPYCPEYLDEYERYDHPDMAGIGFGLRTEHRKV